MLRAVAAATPRAALSGSSAVAASASATPLRRALAPASSSVSAAGFVRSFYAARFYSLTPPALRRSKKGNDDEELHDDGIDWYIPSDPEEIISVNSDLSQDEARALIESELAKIAEEKEAKKFKDWKPGERKRPLKVSYRLEDFEAELSGEPMWTLRDKRCGALGIKLGMMPVWDEWGERHPCTVLYLDSNVVLRNKKSDGKDGYDSVQVGAGERKRKNVNRALLNVYKQHGVDDHPPYIVREFRVTTTDAMPEPGTRIHARHFVPGQNVDVSGISKGKGFQGGMKRWGFAGMPASHGTSRSHRAIGSTGQCQDPGRVFKGKKMPGRMGGDRITVQNLRVVKIDRGRDLIYLRGQVPGQKGNFVEIRDAVKKPLWGTDKVAGGAEANKFPPLPTYEYEEGIDGCGEPGHEEIMPLAEKDPFAPEEQFAA